MYQYKHYSIETVKDGAYDAEIVVVEAGQSTAGTPTVYWVLRIVGSPADGTLVLARFTLSSPKAVEYHKKRLSACGMEAANRVEFEESKDRLVGKRVRITAATNDAGYQCYYIVSLLPGEDAGALTGTDPIDPVLKW